MKGRNVICAATMLLAATVFTGTCMGAQEDITGDWYLNAMEEDGQSFDPSMLGMTIILSLEEDGTAQLDSGEEVVTGTWDAETMILSVDGEYPIVMEDEMLTISEDEMKMIFGREPSEGGGFEVTPVVADAQLEDFNGTWVAEHIVMEGMALPVSMLGESLTITIEDGVITYTHETLDDGEESEPESYTFTGEFADGVLSFSGGSEEGYTVLSLKLHEDGTMSDGYTEPEETEEVDAEPETEEESFDFNLYFVYVKAE